MLNREEAQFYFWLAKSMAHAPGSIVDLGCFVGGSTAHLAEGAFRENAEGRGRVFAYDQFRASQKVKEQQLYAKGIAPFRGHDVLPLSKALLAPWSYQIVHRKCRIEQTTWTGGPISVLILDASKTCDSMDKMAEIFFPHLMPGVSVIVQQDELHWREPWIAVQMQRFKDYFAPLCYVPGGAVAYLCVKRLDPSLVWGRRVGGMNDQAMIHSLFGAMQRLSAFGVADKINRQIEAIRLNPGVRKSWRFKTHVPCPLEGPQRVALGRG